jgi:hypothetical protein
VLSFGGAAPAFCTLTVTPSEGFTIGGGTVTITGTGFNGLTPNPPGPAAVTFDGIAAQSYVVNASSTVITVVTPVHPGLGLVPLVVTNNAGSCSTTFGYAQTILWGDRCGPDSFFPSPATGPLGNFAFCMDLSGSARVKVYNSIGDLVAKVEAPNLQAGPQITQLNTARLSPGVYLYILEKDYNSGATAKSHVQKFVVKH